MRTMLQRLECNFASQEAKLDRLLNLIATQQLQRPQHNSTTPTPDTRHIQWTSLHTTCAATDIFPARFGESSGRCDLSIGIIWCHRYDTHFQSAIACFKTPLYTDFLCWSWFELNLLLCCVFQCMYVYSWFSFQELTLFRSGDPTMSTCLEPISTSWRQQWNQL